MKWIVNAALVLVTTVLTLSAFEVILRISNSPAWDSELRAGWKWSGIDGHMNELGYRGQPIHYSKDDIVVVLLGDSQVESTACPFNEIPERDLEQHLRRRDARFRVFSLGSEGYGNDQEYLALKEYFGKYRADAVVLWESFFNDVWNNVFPTHWPEDGVIKPTYWLDHGRLKGPNYQLGELIRKPAQTKIGVLLNRLLHPQKGLDRTWERRLPKPYEPLTHYEGPFLNDWDYSNPNIKNQYLRWENLKNEKSQFSIGLYPRSERMQYGLDLMKKLLGSISDMSSEHHSSFFIFYAFHPDGQRGLNGKDVDDVVVHKRDGLFYRTSSRQVTANQAYVNEGFPTFEIPILLEDWQVHENDPFHLNCAANDQVMRDLSGKIAESLSYPK